MPVRAGAGGAGGVGPAPPVLVGAARTRRGARPGRLAVTDGNGDAVTDGDAVAAGREPLRLDATTVAALRATAVAHGVELGGIVVAAWALLVSRLAGSPDVVVDLDPPGPAPGSSAGTVPLRVTVDERVATLDYLREVQARVAATCRAPRPAVPGQLAGGTHVVALRPGGLSDRLPSGARRDPVSGPSSRSLTLTVDDTSELIAEAVWPPARTDRRSITTRLGYLARILGALAADPAGPLRDVPLLGQDERHRILVEWNATGRPYPRRELMHEPFERQARRRPDAVAVVHGDHLVSYGALNARADRWARRLREAGVGPEVAVGVHLGRTAELVAVLLGVLKAGGAYVPLDPAYPPERLEFMAEDSRMAVLVTDRPGLALRQPVVIMGPDGRPRGTPAPGRTRPGYAGAGNTAYILYTSGSTGRPKGAMIAHSNASDLLHWSVETFRDDLDRVLATTSICFDCSILEIFGPLSWGGATVLADSALDVATLAVGHDVRLLHTVPSVMAELMHLGGPPRTVRTVLLGGEAPWPRLVDEVYRNSGVTRLLNLYGPTECTSYASMAVIGRSAEETPPIGRPVANTRIHLVDRYGNPTAPGAPGEIHIGGRGLARGYLNRPSLTAERFVPDRFAPTPGERAYRSGDLARYDESGVLTFLGRIDDQVKVRGVRVEPAEVERALLAHPAVREAVVAAPEDDRTRRRLIAYLVASTPVPPAAEELRAHLSGVLPAALVPDVFVVLDGLPRMPNGKVDRARLPAADLGTGVPRPRLAPRNDMEKLLVSVWAETFGVDEVGVHDDFYQIGGDSLAAMRIRAQVSDALAVDVPVDLILTRRTVASLADGLRSLAETGGGTGRGPAIPTGPTRTRGTAPLSANQQATWARIQRDEADPTLNLPLCVRLTGALNPAALAASLTELVRRHDILRTAVQVTDTGEAVQVVGRAARVRLPVVDLGGVPAGEREGLARELSIAAADAEFELGRPPILHAVLIRLDAEDHVLSVTLHQLAGDVWSMEGVGRQLMGLYQAAVTGTPPKLAEPRVQYPDWARSQVEWLCSPSGQAQRRYWRDRLAGSSALTLPARGPRLPSVLATSASHDFTLTGELVGRLTALGGQESATLYTVLLTAYDLLLGAWSGQRDFVVGCPTTGRVHPDLATTLGPFVNALVMRADLSGDPTFRALVRRTRDDAWAAYRHQDLPFAQLVRDLDANRDRTRHPLYQASIVLHYLAEDIRPPAGLSVIDFGRRPAPRTTLDLELGVYADSAGARCAVTYREDVCDAVGVARFATGFTTLLHAVTTDPDRPLSDYAPDPPLVSGARPEWRATPGGAGPVVRPGPARRRRQ